MIDISLDIATAVRARLANISIANGFYTDAGLRIFTGRRNVDQADVPCLVINEGEDSVFAQKDTRVSLGLAMAVQGFIACDPDDPYQAGHRLVRDIKRAIFTEHDAGYPHWGRRGDDTPLVNRTTYVGRTVSQREDGASLLSVVVQVRFDVADTLI